MKINRAIHQVLLVGLLLALMFSCKKESPQVAPTISIDAVTDIATTSATIGGNISSDGGSAVTAHGVCWGIAQNPTTSSTKTTEGTGSGSFSSSITGLTPGTIYYIKAYGINAIGTSYSSQLTFTTLAVAPMLTTNEVSSVTSTSASCGGYITNDGGSPVKARGVCWSTHQNPTIADSITIDGLGLGSFSSSIIRLTPGTIYYFKAYAINNIGITYGDQRTTTTMVVLPVITTTTVLTITATTAISGGTITSDGGASVTARGVCWNTSSNPTVNSTSKTVDGIGTGSFNSNITGLSPNTTYYSRAYATNITGTIYGNTTSFKTLIEPVTDFDGNIYHTVTIGTQVWMVENLKTTHYRNGEPIPIITAGFSWNTRTGVYCNYNNDANNSSIYGRLYNWYAIKDNRNIAPTGWHVSTDAEWTTMTAYLGGLGEAGSKLKETGTTHWLTPNTGATNETGFTALAGGCRNSSGVFGDIGKIGYWWSYTTEGPVFLDWYHYLRNDYSSLSSYNCALEVGLSVRCVKD